MNVPRNGELIGELLQFAFQLLENVFDSQPKHVFELQSGVLSLPQSKRRHGQVVNNICEDYLKQTIRG